jgi:hypothetical protein
MQEIELVKNLLERTSERVKNYEEWLVKTGDGFSFIHALNLEREEVRFHTRLIGYLLNPKAGHFQGDKYLQLFFEVFKIYEPTEGFTVEIEKNIGKRDWDNVEGGRIDLLISNKSKEIAFAIEVKIYASEQREQLKRYSNYLSREFKSEKSKVFFLTLEGKQSLFHSTFNKYDCTSFSVDILDWITRCQDASINQSIPWATFAQYIANIKRLTQQNPEKQMNDDILNLITRDSDSFKASVTIISAQNGVYPKFGENLKKAMEENSDLKDEGFRIESSSKLIPNVDSEISFWLNDSNTERVRLYWLGSGLLGIGMHIEVVPGGQLRIEMKEKLSELNLGKNRFQNKNWAWLTEIEELKGQPNLTFDSWQKFQSKELVEKIAKWVVQIATAYRKIVQDNSQV